MLFHLALGGVRRKVGYLTNRIKAKLAKDLIPRILASGVLLVTIPVHALAEDSVPTTPLLPYSIEQAHLVFDTGSPYPVGLEDEELISVEMGESEAQRQTRERQTAAARTRTKPVKSPSLTVQRVMTPEPSFEAKRTLVREAAATYGIPWEILEAVWQVESGKSWDTHTRSFAGATGPAQFMPGTWRAYGVDGNGDGIADIHSAVDAVYSAANYLAANGANRGQIRQALWQYNHANWYVEKVIDVAGSIGYVG